MLSLFGISTLRNKKVTRFFNSEETYLKLSINRRYFLLTETVVSLQTEILI
jgi:hypothetical protein